MTSFSSKPAQLRAALGGPGLVIAVGAHDALSAKLIEEAGFEAIWGSGFGISAVNAVPDANILTMTETLEAVKRMSEAVRIPVIADCDTGYGNAVNVIRTVHEYEHIGVAGICIEDNVFPKRCSFYSGVRRELVALEEHARKIEAAKAAQRDPEFVVVARTEALIAGWGLDEALRRARAYCEAGADAILIHSKEKTFGELAAFAERWNHPCPLVAVPTTYPNVKAEELLAAGFRMAIFANQPLRAAIPAMRSALRAMREARQPGVIEKQIAPLQEVYDLVGVSELEESEQRFLPASDSVAAIIIAAGFETELMPLIADRPKAMLEVRGETILERQVHALNASGINDISVVRGYRKESVNLPGLRYFDNDRYGETGELTSLIQAEAAMTRRFVFLYSDILFDRAVLDKLLRAESDFAIVIDRSWPDALRTTPNALPAKPDLVLTTTPPGSHHRFVASEMASTLLRIGGTIAPSEAHGEFIGMALFSERGARTLIEVYRELSRRPGPLQEASSIEHAKVTDLLQELVDRGERIACIDTYKGWMEIDSFDDYRRAWAETQG